MTLQIRPARNIDDCLHVEAIQRVIWTEPGFGPVPYHLLITAAKNGGVLLMAWDDDQPIGFVFSFVGQTRQGGFKHCSHMAAVLPGYQHQQIGYQLKLAQRKQVLAQGIKHVTWTFDPLIARNAYFNLHKLGATCHTYLRHTYDTETQKQEALLASDRFQVDWWLDSPQVERRLHQQTASPRLVQANVLNPQGPQGPTAALSEAQHLIRIPLDIEAIKQTDLALAQAWQEQVRHLFETAFAAGYRATDFVRLADASYYILTPNGLT